MTCPKSYVYDQLGSKPRGNLYYLKYEADKAIDDLEESHKREVEQLLMEIVKLKERVSEERSAKVNYKISANDLSDGLKEAYAEIYAGKHKRALLYAKNHALEAQTAQDAIRLVRLNSEAFTEQRCADFVAYWTRIRDNHAKHYAEWLEYAEYFKTKAEER